MAQDILALLANNPLFCTVAVLSLVLLILAVRLDSRSDSTEASPRTRLRFALMAFAFAAIGLAGYFISPVPPEWRIIIGVIASFLVAIACVGVIFRQRPPTRS